MKILLKSKFNRLFHFPDRELSLHSMLINCGHDSRGNSDYRWHGLRRGSRPFAIWQYTLSGCGELKYGDRIYKLGPGKAMLVKIPHNHCYYFPQSSQNDWEFIYLSLNGSEVLRLVDNIITKNGPVLSFPQSSQVVDTAIEIINSTINGQHISCFKASSLAYRFAAELLESAESNPDSESRVPDFINDVINFVMENLDKSIGIEDMAKVSGYSKYHFSRLFSEYMHISPGAFLSRARLNHARNLLQTKRYFIKETAGLCGFNDMSHFSAEFKKLFGTTPKQFRECSKEN